MAPSWLVSTLLKAAVATSNPEPPPTPNELDWNPPPNPAAAPKSPPLDAE